MPKKQITVSYHHQHHHHHQQQQQQHNKLFSFFLFVSLLSLLFLLLALACIGQDQTLLLRSHSNRAISNQYIVILNNTISDVETVVQNLIGSLMGVSVLHTYTSAIKGFAVLGLLANLVNSFCWTIWSMLWRKSPLWCKSPL